MPQISKIFFTALLIFIFANTSGFAQKDNQSDYITVLGDSLVGKVINGEAVRQVYGHVVLTQGNVRVTCNQAIQYLADNNAELIGNVIATQDTLTITTQKAFYFGNEKKAETDTSVRLNDKKVILTADSGVYFFDLDKAIFKGNVTLFDTSSTLTSQALTYFRKEGKAIAVDSVKIVESNNIIRADSLIHFRESRITYANRNVRISSTNNNTVIFGNHLEDYPKNHYTLITERPLMIQIDSSYSERRDTLAAPGDTSTLKIDTLVIRSLRMEAFRDTVNIFRAMDSVRIVRGSFASRNDYTEYFRSKGEIVTKQLTAKSPQPVIWYDTSQLTGDSVAIFLVDNKIRTLDVNRNAFILSQNETYKKRYDQMSGSRLVIHFLDGRIEETEVYGGIHSIYYLYEDNSPNGLSKSSSDSAKIFFDNNKVSEVKLYGTPNSEYYPENKVEGSELTFTLPGYIIYNDRPEKAALVAGEESLPGNYQRGKEEKLKGKSKDNFGKMSH